MKSIHLYIIVAFLFLFSACENDLLKTTIQDGTAPVLMASSTQITLTRADSANNALTLTWTDPKYLENTNNGNVIGTYIVEIAKAETFANASTIPLGNSLTQSFSGYKLNKMLLDMACETGTSNDIYIRVRSAFFSSDTLV